MVLIEGAVADVPPAIAAQVRGRLVAVRSGSGRVSQAVVGEPTAARDGIPDTSDNNGDGACDARDVEAGKQVGPMNIPAVPTSDADPLYHFAQVVTDGFPYAFTNPFVLDMNGNGRFDPPGLGGGP